MRKRRPAISLLAMPIVVLIWFIGWSLFWFGEKKKKLKPDSAYKKEISPFCSCALPTVDKG
jgi:hypothetical protein